MGQLGNLTEHNTLLRLSFSCASDDGAQYSMTFPFSPQGLSAVEMLQMHFSGLVCRIYTAPPWLVESAVKFVLPTDPAALLMLASHC